MSKLLILISMVFGLFIVCPRMAGIINKFIDKAARKPSGWFYNKNF
ncbi:hypothetical protein [Halocella sp. SP3-1]|nr:hypothetical protein [Halocella sp. SP3-1]